MLFLFNNVVYKFLQVNSQINCHKYNAFFKWLNLFLEMAKPLVIEQISIDGYEIVFCFVHSSSASSSAGDLFQDPQ